MGFLKTMHWVDVQKRDTLFQGIASGDQYGGPTKMAQILYESIEGKERLSVQDVTARYLDWWKTDAFDTGPVFDAVFAKINEGTWRADAAFQVHLELNGETAGCNPVHRIAPLALFRFVSFNALGSIARKEARITHWHEIAGDMSAVMAYLCWCLLKEQSWEDAKSITAAMEPEAWELIEQAKISKDGYAPNVMRTAIEFLDQPNSLERAFEFAGFGNYCPVIVGTLDALRKQHAPTKI